LTFVDDIIQVWLLHWISTGCEVINIGRGQPVRLADFVDIIEGSCKEARVKSLPAPASEPPITFASVEKAHRLLNYQPHTLVPEGLMHTWDWYRKFHNLNL
jgi:UDP-glucuronate 4-epimerase